MSSARWSSGEESPVIVAIDGPAGAGKSTAARRLAERLSFRYLDTGAMYRTVTLLALERGLDLGDAAPLEALAVAAPISLAGERVLVDGRDVTEAIRAVEIDRAVSGVAAHDGVRRAMRARQRELAGAGDAVVEGRDIGTVVCPGAEVKVYLVAEAGERARRRRAERPEAGDDEVTGRDERDAAQLAPATDAEVIDTTWLTIDEVVERIARLVAVRAEA
ncbi:MAG: (d)CMP kinase [Thermoleophilia bacterium]|nr:(d)CMP kinase [Thermoleophilia bacterium]